MTKSDGGDFSLREPVENTWKEGVGSSEFRFERVVEFGGGEPVTVLLGEDGEQVGPGLETEDLERARGK
ncbi:hypothetical protein [Haladaptatus sp. NG-WS-4]